ncbi:MAG TPA: MG2 domain-containing protein, partial [Acetobacteraceae bacterium]|nr:MG2 domain-containing protein [Acetobacteraceae bacterium]
MRLFRILALVILAALAAPPAPAQTAFQLPGLQRDANAYLGEMRRRFPAGGSPQQRAQAEARAGAAERARDWPAAAAAWEERIGLGAQTGEHWMALARAQLARTPPEAARALQAAWQAFTLAPAGEPEVPSLLLMAEALRRLDRPVQMIEALEAVVERVPEDRRYRDQLAAARRAAGMLVRGVSTEPDAEPARACMTFTVAPARRTDWQPGDWIRADPPLPNLAVERDGDALCIAGLPWGRSTRLVLRAGLPGEDNTNLRADTPVTIAMPNREARIAFDTRAFLLPRGQEARVSVATVNVSSLQLRVLRVTERNLVPLRRNWTPGEAMELYSVENVSEEMGRVVWEGRVDIPRFEANRTQRTAIPLPEALRGFGPGLFVLSVRQGDGGAGGGERAAAALPILATDLGVVAWRGADGVAVQVRGFGDARPKAGVRVMLMARNNDVLAEARTDGAGLVRFGAPLLRGRAGMAPAAVHAEEGEDLAALSLEAASFDLSDRGATGRPHPGPLDAFVWLDRGIFRPGETVNIAALLRDSGGMPADIPVRLRVRRPNGQVFAESVPARQGGASLHWPMRLSANAQFGAWTVEVLTDPEAPPIGSAQFRVDAFVPQRLDVQIGQHPPQLVPGRPFEVPVTARFLYGAPGAGLSGSAELRLRPDPEPFENWRGWRFGLASETFEPDLQTFEMEETDDQGRATLTINLPQAPDTTRPLRANVSVSVSEPGGRETRARFEVPVRARGTLIAVRPAFSDDAINEGTEAAFDIAAVSPEGTAVPATLRVRLVRERPNWRIVTRGLIARYETVWRDEPVDAQEVRVTPQATLRFARTLPFGRYRLEVADANGLGITSIRFRSGWAGVDAAEVPDRVDVSADRRAYAPGDRARIRIQPPFAGVASVAVLTDRLVSIQELSVPADGAEVEVPVEAAWGPGAYVAVTVFRPGEVRQGHPGRALGLAWV